MISEPKKYDDDDGRVIVNMDVVGMPWHDKRARREAKAARTPTPTPAQSDPLTQSEARRFTWNAVLAGLLIVGVFAATWVLFVLFCTNIWFR